MSSPSPGTGPFWTPKDSEHKLVGEDPDSHVINAENYV